MPTKGSIYTLTDPRDGTIRYVGKTTKQLSERLAGHLASPTNPAMRLWINTLSAQRLIPLITLVATTSEERLSTEEVRQIRRHAKQGHRLLNAPYYQQHLHDLTTPPPPPWQRVAPRPVKRPDPVRAFCRKEYRAIARVRITTKTVVPVTAIVALITAQAVAYMLFRLRSVQVAGVAALTWPYLSSVGFDRLAKEQILPRLPVDQVADFWGTYLDRPLTLIALHALALMCVRALSVYVEMRRTAHKVPAVRPPREPDAVDEAAAAAADDLDRALLEIRRA